MAKKTQLFRLPSGTVAYLEMNSVGQILKDKGLDTNGDVQKQFTNIVNNRITRYMPAGPQAVLSTKLKRIKSPTEIEVAGPYAHYQYKGEVWGPNIPRVENGVVVGYWSPAIKYPTGRKLKYSKTYNKLAGPFWDKRLMAAEGKAMAADLQRFLKKRR